MPVDVAHTFEDSSFVVHIYTDGVILAVEIFENQGRFFTLVLAGGIKNSQFVISTVF
jgi:hypothetical protein